MVWLLSTSMSLTTWHGTLSLRAVISRGVQGSLSLAPWLAAGNLFRPGSFQEYSRLGGVLVLQLIHYRHSLALCERHTLCAVTIRRAVFHHQHMLLFWVLDVSATTLGITRKSVRSWELVPFRRPLPSQGGTLECASATHRGRPDCLMSAPQRLTPSRPPPRVGGTYRLQVPF